jgi:heme exporter protein C
VWDARLTTTLILWLIEIAYLLLRAYVDDPEKAATYGAVVGLFGALDIPIVHYSVQLWRGMHPAVLVQRAGEIAEPGARSGLPPEFVQALMISMATFTLMFVMLLAIRVRLQSARMQLIALQHEAFDG